MHALLRVCSNDEHFCVCVCACAWRGRGLSLAIYLHTSLLCSRLGRSHAMLPVLRPEQLRRRLSSHIHVHVNQWQGYMIVVLGHDPIDYTTTFLRH